MLKEKTTQTCLHGQTKQEGENSRSVCLNNERFGYMDKQDYSGAMKRFQSRRIFSCHLQDADSASNSGKCKLCWKICSSFLFYLMFLRKGTSSTLLAGSVSVSVTVFKLLFLKNITVLNGDEQDTVVLKTKYQR